MALQRPGGHRLLVTASQLLVAHHRRAHPADGHQQIVVFDLVGLDDPNPATVAHHLQDPQSPEVGIPSAAGAQYSCSQRNRREIRLADLPHGTSPAHRYAATADATPPGSTSPSPVRGP